MRFMVSSWPLSHLLERVEPSHILVAFDAGKTTFRTEMYAPNYKGGRTKTPDDFVRQFLLYSSSLGSYKGFVTELAQLWGGWHYWDIDKLAEQDGFDITIVSGDKDLIQLTDEHAVIEFLKRVWLGLKAFTHELSYGERWASHRISLSISKALMGDKSDIFLEVTKIGERRVSKALAGAWKFSLEGFMKCEALRWRKISSNDKGTGLLSKTLATGTKAPVRLVWRIWSIVVQIMKILKFYDEMEKLT